MKNIVLFDMDGTLTPARKPAAIPIAVALHELARYATVGIVTGSHYDYLQQQCETILNSLIGPDLSNVLLFPCNGGQFYRWENGAWQKITDKNMHNYLGNQKFNELIKACICTLNASLDDACEELWDLTGQFIQYRGPMVNLCFPGRQAEHSARQTFQKLDVANDVRSTALRRLRGHLIMSNINNLECKLGGDTSIDIFPVGWDKTLALEHLKDFTVWFVGDRCTGDGNDREIFEYAAKNNQGFQTKSPAETIDIIEHITKTIRGNVDK